MHMPSDPSRFRAVAQPGESASRVADTGSTNTSHKPYRTQELPGVLWSWKHLRSHKPTPSPPPPSPPTALEPQFSPHSSCNLARKNGKTKYKEYIPTHTPHHTPPNTPHPLTLLNPYVAESPPTSLPSPPLDFIPSTTTPSSPPPPFLPPPHNCLPAFRLPPPPLCAVQKGLCFAYCLLIQPLEDPSVNEN